MKKIAILGSENSHCMLFASTFAPKDGKKLFEDIELLGVYGDPNEPGVAEGNWQYRLTKDQLDSISRDKFRTWNGDCFRI